MVVVVVVVVVDIYCTDVRRGGGSGGSGLLLYQGFLRVCRRHRRGGFCGDVDPFFVLSTRESIVRSSNFGSLILFVFCR